MDYQNLRQGPKRRLLLTKKGLDTLKKKLDELTASRRSAIRELQATDKNDIDEIHLSARIQQLESAEIETIALNDLLQRVEPVVKSDNPQQVSLGCTVGLKNDSMTVLYTIVCSLEVDTENNKISDESILGSAALGKRVGDSFSIATPKGKTVFYEVISIS